MAVHSKSPDQFTFCQSFFLTVARRSTLAPAATYSADMVILERCREVRYSMPVVGMENTWEQLQHSSHLLLHLLQLPLLRCATTVTVTTRSVALCRLVSTCRLVCSRSRTNEVMKSSEEIASIYHAGDQELSYVPQSSKADARCELQALTLYLLLLLSALPDQNLPLVKFNQDHAISIAIIHHFATVERRIESIKVCSHLMHILTFFHAY